MMFQRTLHTLLAGLFVLSASGCLKIPPTSGQTRSAADERFIKICTEEFKINVVVKPLKNTVWIYVPMKTNLFDYKASEKKGPEQAVPSATNSRVLKFLDGSFDNRMFLIKFMVTKESKPPSQDLGYSPYYTDAFQSNQRNILGAIYRAYGDLEKVPGDVDFADPSRDQTRDRMVKAYIKTEKAPDFFVLTIADIGRGIESKTTLHFNDLVRGMTDLSFYEEYARRLVTDELRGNPSITDDLTGKHLNAVEIAWPEFLTKQVLGRIRFKYQQSDFPPTEEDVNEILKLIHATVTAYSFKDFDGVKLTDLNSGKEYDFRREQLATFAQ